MNCTNLAQLQNSSQIYWQCAVMSSPPMLGMGRTRQRLLDFLSQHSHTPPAAKQFHTTIQSICPFHMQPCILHHQTLLSISTHSPLTVSGVSSVLEQSSAVMGSTKVTSVARSADATAHALHMLTVWIYRWLKICGGRGGIYMRLHTDRCTQVHA